MGFSACLLLLLPITLPFPHPSITTMPPRLLPSMATIQERRCLETLLQGNRDGSDLGTGWCYERRVPGGCQVLCWPSCEVLLWPS